MLKFKKENCLEFYRKETYISRVKAKTFSEIQKLMNSSPADLYYQKKSLKRYLSRKKIIPNENINLHKRMKITNNSN